MAKITVNCIKCGKELKLDFDDSRAVCKKCRKMKTIEFIRTSKVFDF
ncbi:MAG: hypothetical protein ACFFB6_04995 [Promethearchaeota archaeon]